MDSQNKVAVFFSGCNDFKQVLCIYFQNSNMENDQYNYWRLARIMFDDVQQKLRDLFKTKFRERYNIAWGDNRTTGEFFISNVNIRGRDRQSIDVIRQGDSAAFDFTVLFNCLLFSDAGILLPRTTDTNRRKPPIVDSERVDELRHMRNQLAHPLSTTLPQPAFNQKLASLEDIYAQLHWDPTEMRRLAQDPLDNAKIIPLQRQLDAERKRLSALEGMSSYL